jgi:dCMP deaminase
LLKSDIIKCLRDAYYMAKRSPDKSSQNGAVLLKCLEDGSVYNISSGYNHYYGGFNNKPETREQKLQEIEHAERDAIFKAARLNFKLNGAIMVCPWAACFDCARAIIGSGCHGLIVHKERQDLTPPRWKEQIDAALERMSHTISIYEFSGCIPNTCNILISGKLWSPSTCEYV